MPPQAGATAESPLEPDPPLTTTPFQLESFDFQVPTSENFSNMSQFSIKWNNHESSIVRVFREMYDSETLCDVTIACEGESLQAHKLVLSACSPYFQYLFMANPCKHPIVILKDVQIGDMRLLIEFMYRGEVTVHKDQIATLLKTGETLQIRELERVVKKPSHDAPLAQAMATTRKRRRKSRRNVTAGSGAGDGLPSESDGEANSSAPSQSKQIQQQVIYYQEGNPEGVDNDGQIVQDAQTSRILEVSMNELVGGGGEEVTGEVQNEDAIDEQVEGDDGKGREELDANDLNTLVAYFGNDSESSIMLMKKKLSFVWDYFNETGKGSVKCRTCGKLLSYKDTSGSTSNMIKHLKTVHSVERVPKLPLQE